MHCLNYNGQESKKQFAVYDSDTPVTLKYGQSHQTWYKLVDPKKGYNHAKIERPSLNSVWKKAKVFVKSDNVSIISLEYAQKSEEQWYICIIYLTYFNNPTKT